MKKKQIVFLVAMISIIILTIVLLFTTIVLLFIDSKKGETYILPPKMTNALFGTTPEQFFDVDLMVYNYCDDFRSTAYVDASRNLVLKLTNDQQKAILDFYDSDIDDLNAMESVSISEDYRNIRIVGNEDSICDIYFNHMKLFIFLDMAFRQLFNGIAAEDILITVNIVEEGTEKIVYSASWPNEVVRFAVKEYDFSN